MTTYTIPAIAKEELQKKLERLKKKANSYGNKLEWRFGEEKVVDRNVYSVDPVTQVLYKTSTDKVFGIEINIDSDIIRKDGYTVIAQIEAIDNGQNIVKMFGEGEPEQAWYTTKLFCEHCGTARVKRFAYIVKDETGHAKMVGKTCLKDYCGIDPKFIAMNQEIGDLIENEYGIDDFDFGSHGEYAFDVMKAVAIANDIVKQFGYVKSCEDNSTKTQLMIEVGKTEPSEESKKLAEEMKEYYSRIDYKDLTDFQCNIKNLLQSGYTRIRNLGYIAYAPVDYLRMKEQQEQEQLRNEAKGNSEYIGNIGEKITVDLKEAKIITSWETVYGITFLWKFITTDGNTLVWKASRYQECEPKHITGTVKDHKEYDGEKQTVLTRCKLS